MNLKGRGNSMANQKPAPKVQAQPAKPASKAPVQSAKPAGKK
ncbi:MAG: hypothetical protein V3575_04260 [Candidatus Absconditabacteria bacterium]